MVFTGLWTLAFVLAGTGVAHADPITTAIFGAAFAATFVGQVVTFVISTAISIGLSLLARALQKKPPGARDPGIQFDVEIGDDSPIGFVVGQSATAGTRKYIGTWGNAGKTPNAYLTDVIQVGDLPAPGQPGLWVNGKKGTILWGETPLEQGYPVEEFRVEGKDHLWVLYRDGTETTVDSFLLAKFGSVTDREWQSDMIGRGCPHLILTALVNRELFPGQMQWLAEPPPTAWYDLRKDDTAGGAGAHRWDDPTTWEPTDNNVVIVYNIARGVYYGDEWVFGGQDLPAFRLPAANWMAGANECDVLIDLAGGGNEKQFRCGMEMRGDMEPLAVIEELLKACNGRFAEVGGIFKILVGAPGAAVYAFTDGDIVVTKGQSLRPFPGLDETHNGIEATYPEPAEMWANKDAPARYSDDFEVADGDRRLITGVNFAAAPFGVQVQRLMKALIEAERHFRIHSFFLPPEAWLLEPGVDVVSWTSVANGYVNKKFLIVTIRGERTRNQFVVLIEIDPADYDWVPATDEQPSSVGFLGPIRPAAQEIVGWAANGILIVHDNGQKKAGVKIEWDADVDDVIGVRFQVRLKATAALVLDATTDAWEDGEAVTTQNLASITVYEARGKYLPGSARQTDWSDWIEFTTPDARVTQAELDAALDGLLNQLHSESEASLAVRLASLEDRIEALAAVQGGAYSVTDDQINSIVAVIGQRMGLSEAQIVTAQSAIADQGQAIADFFVGLRAVNPQGQAEVQFQMLAAALPEGAVAAVEFLLRAGVGGQFASAALQMAAMSTTELGLHSRVQVKAEQFDAIDGAGNVFPLLLSVIAGEPLEAAIVAGSPNTVTPDLRSNRRSHHTLLTAAATMQFPLGAALGKFWVHQVEQDDTGTWPMAFDPVVFVGEPPAIDAAANALTVLDCEILRLSPPKAIATVRGGGSTEIGSPRSFGITPAIDGKTIWDLDADGPCVGTGPGTYLITPLGTHLQTDSFEIWGPGGSSGATYLLSGGGDSDDYDGLPGAESRLTVPGGTDLVAGPGEPSPGYRLHGAPATGSRLSTAEPAGGVASGGDVNTDGNPGVVPTTNGFSIFGGIGPAAPAEGDPGGGGERTYGPNSPPGRRHANPGNPFGGGASGASSIQAGPAPVDYGAGTSSGGSGAYVKAAFDDVTRVLENGVSYELVLGAPGAAANGVDEGGGGFEVANGALGGASGFIIT